MSEPVKFWLPKVKLDPLERARAIGRVVETLEELPHNQDWRVEVEEMKSERSLQQNKYLFGVAYPRIMEATGYEKMDVHEHCLKGHFGVRLKKVPLDRFHSEGLAEVPLRTTTTNEHGHRSVLGKVAFMEYVEFVKRWAAEIGVYIPDPNEHEEMEKAA